LRGESAQKASVGNSQTAVKKSNVSKKARSKGEEVDKKSGRGENEKSSRSQVFSNTLSSYRM